MFISFGVIVISAVAGVVLIIAVVAIIKKK